MEAVALEDNTDGLLVTYLSSGDTPRNSYLWILDENGLPKVWHMWVGVLPIAGLEVGWSEWVTLTTGAKVATKHEALMSMAITNLKNYQVADRDIFDGLQ